MILDQLFTQDAPDLTETSDYARRREQEKKKQQAVAENWATNPANPMNPISPIGIYNPGSPLYIGKTGGGGSVSPADIEILYHLLMGLIGTGVAMGISTLTSSLLDKARDIASRKARLDLGELREIRKQIKQIYQRIDTAKDDAKRQEYQDQLKDAFDTIKEIEARIAMKSRGEVDEQGVSEGEELKFKVTYDIYGNNREVPLYTDSRLVRAKSEKEAIDIIRKFFGGRNHRIEQGVAEAGPFSYGAKKPRQGTVAHTLAQRARAQGLKHTAIEPRDQQVGVAKIITGHDLCPACSSADIKTYSDGEKECNQCHRTWDVKGVAEGYEFKGDFPFDVDHMPGAVHKYSHKPTNPSSKKFFHDKAEWEQAVNEFNSTVFDDHSEFVSGRGVYEVRMNDFAWAKWSDKQNRGYIDMGSMSEQGVVEGHADQQRKIFKKNGKPVGEVGIDRESSPGVGQYYMKCYATGDDLSGYDSYEEAVAELKHCLKQAVAEGNRFDEPLTGYHIVYRKSGQVVHATPSFETRDAAQRYLMTRMFANHQDYRVAHTAQLGLAEDLRKWFREKWVRFNPQGKIMGACARGDDSEGKPKCLPQAKAHALGKAGRASAAARKRREDPNPERRGAAKNVATKEAQLSEKQDACYRKVKSRYKVWPSAYASGALVQCRKRGAANWGNKS